MRYYPKGDSRKNHSDAQILTQSLAYDLQTNHTYLEHSSCRDCSRCGDEEVQIR